MAKDRGEAGGSKSNPLVGPLYSSGTPDMDAKNEMGEVEGPKGGKSIPDPTGFAGHPTKGR